MVHKSNEISKRNLYDRVKKLLVSYDWSDCSFSVSGKDFKAHKLILGISSPVFEAMFYGPLSTEQDVLITDIEPDIFQLVLNYIYTDYVEITSIEQAFELLYASRKYLLEHLTEMCIAYIQENISVDNVIEVLNYPEYLQDKQLISFSLKLFCQHAYHLIQENKVFISLSCLKLILECEKINIMEKDLIKQVFEWTTCYCTLNDITCTFENRRQILIDNGILKLLRIFTLSMDDIEEITKDENNLLLPNESDHIKRVAMQSEDVASNNYNNLLGKCLIPRTSISMQWHFCHRSPIRPVAPIVIDSSNNVVTTRLKSNKSIFLNSLYIPTRMAPAVTFRTNSPKIYSEQLCISIISESDNNVIKHTNFMNNVEYNAVVDVELNEPCLLKKDEWYKICFTWPQNRFVSYSYVAEFRDTVYKGHKICLDFDDSSSVGSCGSFLGGLKYCL
ncbi:kelch-like protein 40 [Plodia interpunctella]|uniref:kelch-like protein 40 n=1 Tax=Plodia interpunctella TaxID=58824 RepID=UPI0023687B27|nr:kelch-like protein 40 [Plodia interpunctella]XP_053608164.1 kelch-like protein 40 [Plodia interpunctella]